MRVYKKPAWLTWNGGLTKEQKAKVRQWLEVICSKASVCLCGVGEGCNAKALTTWCGPQRKALRAFDNLVEIGVCFPPSMGIALGHARMPCNEGRGEFDEIAKEWRSRVVEDLGL